MAGVKASKSVDTPDKVLATVLSTLRQGDLISLGAVTIVGRGPSGLLAAAGAENVPHDQLWSLTAESSVGWYVILSQDCDIVRDPTIEPCLMVCPLEYVSVADWTRLRHGPYSPREFPYPTDKLPILDDQRPVADVRVVTSVEKRALLGDGVETLRPLTAAQHHRFAEWVARRFARAAHDEMIESNVLAPAAGVILGLIGRASAGRGAEGSLTASGRFCLAIEEWLVGGNDRAIDLVAVTTPASLRAAGLADEDGIVDTQLAESGRAWIENKIASRMPGGAGYVCNLTLRTLDRITADQYRGLAPWYFDNPGDVLAD